MMLVFNFGLKCSCQLKTESHLRTPRRNYGAAQKTLKVKTQLSRGTEKTVSEKERNGRKSAKRRKRRRRSGRRSAKRRGNEKESGSARGSETENGTETEKETETGIGTGEHGAATPTAATPVGRRTGKGADPVIAGGPGAETRTERGNANAAGMVDVDCLHPYLMV